ncbi:unnamed protein product [Durusdinium trenchii]|uniref:Uncharacterized protein n=1 Tax=Durusdinium trenchii TaxID=1381693 RepID=A0ABP0R6T6_9DINO
MTDFLGRLRSLLFLPSTVAIMCRSDEMGPWWNAWLASATEPEGPGIQHVALTDRSRCPMISFIRQIRQGHPTFRVLDIGAVGNPWSIHSGVVDAIFDYQATNYPPCFSTAELHTRGRRCCSSKDDDCFDSLYTRERCCRGEEPVFVAMIDGDVTDALGEGWAKLMAFVDTVGKFDLVLTSHLLEDVTDPSVVVRLLPRVATAGAVDEGSWPRRPLQARRRRATHVPAPVDCAPTLKGKEPASGMKTCEKPMDSLNQYADLNPQH